MLMLEDPRLQNNHVIIMFPPIMCLPFLNLLMHLYVKYVGFPPRILPLKFTMLLSHYHMHLPPISPSILENPIYFYISFDNEHTDTRGLYIISCDITNFITIITSWYRMIHVVMYSPFFQLWI